MGFLQESDGQHLAAELYRIGAVRFGHEIPIQFNLRVDWMGFAPGPINEWSLKALGLGLSLLTKRLGLSFDAVCGVPLDGEPLADGLNHVQMTDSPVRLVTIRPSGQRRGISRLYPTMPSGKKVLLVHTMVELDDPTLESVAAIHEQGHQVTDLLVVLEQSTKPENKLREADVSIHGLFKVKSLVDHYNDVGLIDRQTRDHAIAYLNEMS